LTPDWKKLASYFGVDDFAQPPEVVAGYRQKWFQLKSREPDMAAYYSALLDAVDAWEWSKDPRSKPELVTILESDFVIAAKAPDSRFTRITGSGLFGADPPPVKWLVRHCLPAEEVTLLIGEGGVGKGHLSMSLCVSLALGEPFGLWDVPAPARILISNCEDAENEMRRRVKAAVYARWPQGPGKERLELLEKNFTYVDLSTDTDFFVEEEQLSNLCLNQDLVIIDPFFKVMPKGTDVNKQVDAAKVMSVLSKVAHLSACSLLIGHHTRKPHQDEKMTVHSGSGSHVLKDLARQAMGLEGVSRVEAEKMMLDPTQKYVRLKILKSNYGPTTDVGYVLRRVEGGALTFVEVGNVDEEVRNLILLKLAEGPCIYEAVVDNFVIYQGLSKKRIQDIIKELLNDNKVFLSTRVEGVNRRNYLYVPSAA